MDIPVPLYHQVAEKLREQIRNHTGPDTALPSEHALGAQFGVGRMTVRRALAVLRDEGLITTRRGMLGSIRTRAPRTEILVGDGQRVIARMPTTSERLMLHMDAGVPLLELTDPAGTVELLPADRYELLGPTPGRPPS